MKRLRLVVMAVLALGLARLPAAARPVWPQGALYGAVAYVTGTRAETRRDGIALCLRRVLVKVSGNPALLDDPRVEALDALAAGMVEDIAYQDRMSDEPHHDEQGTRDRPFDLAVQFDPARIDAALALLGEAAWTAPRPRIFAGIDIRDRAAAFPLSADAEADERQREAILAAADRFGLRVVLTPTDGAPPALPAHPVTLRGTLVWDAAAFGWVGAWHLDWEGGVRVWRITGVSFDEAFRDAMGGTLAALSGH